MSQIQFQKFFRKNRYFHPICQELEPTGGCDLDADSRGPEPLSKVADERYRIIETV